MGPLAWSPDSKSLATRANDRTLVLWDVASGTPWRTLSSRVNGVNSLSWGENGDALAIAQNNGISVWEVRR